jgi:hypothetical protein
MKSFKRNESWKKVLSIIILLLVLVGCESQSPLSSINTGSDNPVFSKISGVQERRKPIDPTIPYPQFASHTFKINQRQKCYERGTFSLPNNTEFRIEKGALAPPPEIPWKSEVTVTMRCDKDPIKNELIFTFGPSGCQFNPAAKVTMHFQDVPLTNPTLFYIDENGNYIEQTPDEIDLIGKNMILNIPHFSRYAIGEMP